MVSVVVSVVEVVLGAGATVSLVVLVVEVSTVEELVIGSLVGVLNCEIGVVVMLLLQRGVVQR